MTIALKLYATLASHLPADADALPIAAGETVRDLLGRFGVPESEIKMIFVNGLAAELDAPLSDGDRVAAFPPVGGG